LQQKNQGIETYLSNILLNHTTSKSHKRILNKLMRHQFGIPSSDSKGNNQRAGKIKKTGYSINRQLLA
jgi:hypothetical protein